MTPFTVVGMGPGPEEYLLPAAARAIAEADVLVGAERFTARYPHKSHVDIAGPVSAVIESIEKERRKRKVAVLVSGDPGLFSLQKVIGKHFGPNEYVVIPGLSSFQLACARTRITWEGAVIVSVHGRDMSELDRIEEDRPAVVFTDREHAPNLVAALLAARGHGKGSGRESSARRCIVAENAGESDERIVDATLSAVASMSFSGLCVMVLP